MLQNGNDRPRRKVEKWDTLEVLFSGRRVINRVDIGFVIKIEQPIFEDGSRGYPKLGVTLNRGDRFLRFECFDGDLSEVEALSFLLGSITKPELESFQRVYDDFMMNHRENFSYRNKSEGNIIDRDAIDQSQPRRTRRRDTSGY